MISIRFESELGLLENRTEHEITNIDLISIIQQMNGRKYSQLISTMKKRRRKLQTETSLFILFTFHFRRVDCIEPCSCMRLVSFYQCVMFLLNIC